MSKWMDASGLKLRIHADVWHRERQCEHPTLSAKLYSSERVENRLFGSRNRLSSTRRSMQKPYM